MTKQESSWTLGVLGRIQVVFLLLLQVSMVANAGVVINGTRLVYRASDREVTVRLNNNGDQPSLVQVWLDSGDAKSTPDTASAPFIATPPIFRINPNKGQTVRIVYTGEALPEDKESVFWLNVLDIPPSPPNLGQENVNIMQLAIRSRIKVFYRPQSLTSSAAEAATQVRWSLVEAKEGFVMRATNASNYHVSLGTASIKLAQKNYEVEVTMLSPGASLDFPIPVTKSEFAAELGKTSPNALRVEYSSINDFGVGAFHTAETKLVQ